MAKNDDLHLTGVFDDIEDAPLKPGLFFRVDHFFLDHWLPLLGPTLAWLVVALQQACRRGGRPGNTAEISQAELGRQCGLGRQRVNHLLNHEPLLRWFLPEITQQTRDGKQQNNRYRVRLASPPTPALVAGLRQEIENRLAGDEPLPEIVRALTAQAKRERTDLLARLCAGGGEGEKPQTVADVVAAFAGVMDPDLQEAAGELSRALLRPKQVRPETQYFRRKWLPELGATAAWLVVYLRHHCHADDNERDGTFSMRKVALAAGLGVSGRTLRRTLKTPVLAQFFVSLDNHGQSLAGQVRMRDPLIPADAAKARELTQEQAVCNTLPLARNRPLPVLVVVFPDDTLGAIELSPDQIILKTQPATADNFGARKLTR